MAILLPTILVAMFTAAQIAVYYLAREEALGAAQQYVTAQRQFGAPAGVGVTNAKSFLSGNEAWLTHAYVTPGSVGDPTQVSVTVGGDAISLIPWVHFSVAEIAHGTIERTTPGTP